MEEIPGQTAYVLFLRGGSKKPLKAPATRRLQKTLLAALVLTLAATVTIMCMVGWSNFGNTEGPLPTAKVLYTTRSKPSFEDWTEEDFQTEFHSFAAAYGKIYGNDTEKTHRYNIFRKHLTYIVAHNQQDLGFTLEMNKFGDLTDQEFSQMYANLRPKSKPGENREVDWSLATVNPAELPTSIDWRERGCVTEVKDQQKCGSCWAFSTTGAVEGAVCVKTGVLPDLSEQQLVDCAGPEGNLGCNGGEADWGFQYVVDNKGLCREDDYPYHATSSGYCKARKCHNIGKIRAFRDVPPENELALRAALTKYGPTSIALEADGLVFKFYKSGVFSARCGTNLDHATLLVGYGTDEKTGEDYFIMKNSWGTNWGENGYMRLRRVPANKQGEQARPGKAGECGILETPSYALS